MLWLCICFPRLPFEALSLDDTKLSVVTLIDGRVRRIVRGSKAAEQLGFACGMDCATASTLCTTLKALDRNSHVERKALERLAIWAYQWSSSVTLHLADAKSLTEPSAVALEIAGSFKLFGGRAALLKRIEDELKQLNYDYTLGVAYTVEGAALLARSNRRIVADTEDSLRRQLSKLPISLLALPNSVIFELERAGIRTIDTFIDLPKDAIARRFGPEINEYLDRLLGIAPDPRPAFQLPKKYRARCEFGIEVTSTEALLFPLRRMLCELQGYLRAIDSGIQRFVLHLKHRQGTTRVAIGLSTSERDAERFFTLVRERFERLPLTAPVLAIGLQADRFTPPAIQQNELFINTRQTTEQLQHTLDKLVARLGADAVQGFKLVADHRPEKAWANATPATTSHSNTVSTPRPLWLLAEPHRINAPTTFCDPECIEGGWWDGDDVQRDYCFVRTANGATLWVYRDLKSNEWFLHGLCG